MTALEELKKIKRLYGEDFMHLCRNLFSTILEQEGLLIEILQTTFATNSRTLGKDINLVLEDDFKNYIFNKVATKTEKIVETDINAFQELFRNNSEHKQKE